MIKWTFPLGNNSNEKNGKYEGKSLENTFFPRQFPLLYMKSYGYDDWMFLIDKKYSSHVIGGQKYVKYDDCFPPPILPF
jgi:hypothetical protein